MSHNFQVEAIPASTYQAFFAMSPSGLQAAGAVKMITDAHPGYPCRVSLQDARPGEEVLLLYHFHHPTGSPYRAGGPIFIRKNAETAHLPPNELPLMLRHRLQSLRSYDREGMMIKGTVVSGSELESAIQAAFDHPEAVYLDVHNAGPGCFNCRIRRLG